MRLWHYKLLEYLPDLQFKGQLRELILIKREWERKGKPNHLLVNKVIEFPKSHLQKYFTIYQRLYEKRYNKCIQQKYIDEFNNFCDAGIDMNVDDGIFTGWHNDEYLKICMANLYEKYKYALGDSKIKDNEWSYLVLGYKNNTGIDFSI